MKKGSLKRCTHCLARKQNQSCIQNTLPYKEARYAWFSVFWCVWPYENKTLGGSLYFVTFIDDHSRKIWVYTLNTKDQVLNVFKQIHAFVERQSGEKLKCIWTDNGGEYSGPFDEYCNNMVFDIKKHLLRLLSWMGWLREWIGHWLKEWDVYFHNHGCEDPFRVRIWILLYMFSILPHVFL